MILILTYQSWQASLDSNSSRIHAIPLSNTKQCWISYDYPTPISSNYKSLHQQSPISHPIWRLETTVSNHPSTPKLPSTPNSDLPEYPTRPMQPQPPLPKANRRPVWAIRRTGYYECRFDNGFGIFLCQIEVGGQIFEREMEGLRTDELTDNAGKVFDEMPERANWGFGNWWGEGVDGMEMDGFCRAFLQWKKDMPWITMKNDSLRYRRASVRCAVEFGLQFEQRELL